MTVTLNPGFLLAEDAAVKRTFTGLTVSDDRKNQREVKVFFRNPEGETEKVYPFITVENIGISHARDVQHSEHYYYYYPAASTVANQVNSLDYWPSELDSDGMATEYGNTHQQFDSFVPVYLMYQITTHARSALHDRQLTSQMLKTIIPFRYGSILIPEDDTVRRFNLVSWTNADVLDQEAGYRKRIFRKAYTMQMTAEIPVLGATPVTQAQTVVGSVSSVDNANPPVPLNPITEAV